MHGHSDAQSEQFTDIATAAAAVCRCDSGLTCRAKFCRRASAMLLVSHLELTSRYNVTLHRSCGMLDHTIAPIVMCAVAQRTRVSGVFAAGLLCSVAIQC
jgi:hypothetical protein